MACGLRLIVRTSGETYVRRPYAILPHSSVCHSCLPLRFISFSTHERCCAPHNVRFIRMRKSWYFFLVVVFFQTNFSFCLRCCDATRSRTIASARTRSHLLFWRSFGFVFSLVVVGLLVLALRWIGSSRDRRWQTMKWKCDAESSAQHMEEIVIISNRKWRINYYYFWQQQTVRHKSPHNSLRAEYRDFSRLDLLIVRFRNRISICLFLVSAERDAVEIMVMIVNT